MNERVQKAISDLMERKDASGAWILKYPYRLVVPTDPIGFLKEVAEQVYGIKGLDHYLADERKQKMVDRYGKEIVDLALEMFPEQS